jgi:hypothetical protein
MCLQKSEFSPFTGADETNNVIKPCSVKGCTNCLDDFDACTECSALYDFTNSKPYCTKVDSAVVENRPSFICTETTCAGMEQQLNIVDIKFSEKMTEDEKYRFRA